jgi:hypothetical protein
MAAVDNIVHLELACVIANLEVILEFIEALVFLA